MSGDVSSVFPRWSLLSPIAAMSKTQLNTIYFSPESTPFASVQEEGEAAPRSLPLRRYILRETIHKMDSTFFSGHGK